jgi:5-methylcytosine-specific restriction enzyme A
MARATKEWIGKTDDAMPPPRVRLRIFERTGGVCHISGIKIRPGDKWQADHIVPIILGGENRESNLAPALVEPHKEKTKAEVKIKSKISDTRKKHLGIKSAKQKIQSQGFAKSEKSDRPAKIMLPRRSLFSPADE